jgi:hypothetical protein
MNVPFSIDVNGVPSFNGSAYPGFLPQGTAFLDYDGTFMGTVSSDYNPDPLTGSTDLQFTIDPVFLSNLNLNNCNDTSQSDGPGCIWYRIVASSAAPQLSLTILQVLLGAQDDRQSC